jgi:D-amino-acid oxidase
MKKIAIIGAGIFGCNIALKLSKKKNIKIDIYENSTTILNNASMKNQMRFHHGYHYPRSVETIKEIKFSNKKFISEFGLNFFGTTKNIYSIAKKSRTPPSRYENILKKNKLKFSSFNNKIFFGKDIKKSYLVDEKILNYFKFKKYLFSEIKLKKNIFLFLKTEFKKNYYKHYDKIYLCGYYNNNKILNKLDIKCKFKFKYELVEKTIISLPKKFKKLSFITIDGKFLCIDPYLGTPFHLLSSNKLSKIETVTNFFPNFKSYKKIFLDKKVCKNKKDSFFSIIIKEHINIYPFLAKAKYIGSFFTIRMIPANYNSINKDERLSKIIKVNEKISMILSGKWSSSSLVAEKIFKKLS